MDHTSVDEITREVTKFFMLGVAEMKLLQRPNFSQQNLLAFPVLSFNLFIRQRITEMRGSQNACTSHWHFATNTSLLEHAIHRLFRLDAGCQS